MRDRYDEAHDDRRGQDAVGNGNIEECDDRYPDDIEDGNCNADAFRAQPVEPAEREFALLLAREPAPARQESAPMLLENLEAAIGPAVPLLLVGLEAVWQQAVPVTLVGVVGLPAKLEQREAEIGVFADRVARPSAGGFDRCAPHQAHCAVGNDRIGLVPLHHADVEEAGVFAVHGVVHDTAFAIAMILRRLHQADAGIGEQRHKILQPVFLHYIVSVDDADHVRVGGSVYKGEAQRARFKAGKVIGTHEFKAFSKGTTMIPQPAAIVPDLACY